MLPNTLVTGFPNSGTSFLCNLVAELGYSPGWVGSLKQADEHNRWGYYEYLPIYRYIRWTLGTSTRFTADLMPNNSLVFSDQAINEVRVLAFAGQVEVYKDCAIPFIYRLFDKNAKILVIQRGVEEMFESDGLRHLGYDFTLNGLYRACVAYERMVKKMKNFRNVLDVTYTGFREDFEGEAGKVCEFLGRPYKEELKEVFKPRRA